MFEIFIGSIIVLLGGAIYLFKFMEYAKTNSQSTPQTPADNNQRPVQPQSDPSTTPTTPRTSTESTRQNSHLVTFCTAIRNFEGQPGDLNYQNNNPGNCRCSAVGYAPKYGNVLCVDTASGKFAKFPTYALGWEYLLTLVQERATIHPTWTFLDFFSNYSPESDGNPTVRYAETVAKECGVPVTTQLKDYL